LFFDPSKFDFQIPAGLNSTKSVVRLHLTVATDALQVVQSAKLDTVR